MCHQIPRQNRPWGRYAGPKYDGQKSDRETDLQGLSQIETPSHACRRGSFRMSEKRPSEHRGGDDAHGATGHRSPTTPAGLTGLTYAFDYNNVTFIALDQFTRTSGTTPATNDAILDQVRAAVRDGKREVVLLGQTVNAWRYDGLDFGDLLRRVASVP